VSLASADGDEAGRTEEYWYDELTADGEMWFQRCGWYSRYSE
jgi:hypothetical protein